MLTLNHKATASVCQLTKQRDRKSETHAVVTKTPSSKSMAGSSGSAPSGFRGQPYEIRGPRGRDRFRDRGGSGPASCCQDVDDNGRGATELHCGWNGGAKGAKGACLMLRCVFVTATNNSETLFSQMTSTSYTSSS